MKTTTAESSTSVTSITTETPSNHQQPHHPLPLPALGIGIITLILVFLIRPLLTK